MIFIKLACFVVMLSVFVNGCAFEGGKLFNDIVSDGFVYQLAKKVKRPRTVKDVIKKYGSQARKTMKSHFRRAKVDYPPEDLVLIGLKNEEKLLIYASDENNSFKKITEYPILGTSGEAGPKLKQGDGQMPEGFYTISAFNPNSRFHLSLRVNYPNSEDKRNARLDKRSNLGGDIMIHGSNVSIGCLAMGDDEIEEIFTLVYDTGRDSTKVIMAPCDLTSTKPIIDMKKQPKWLPGLYRRLKIELEKYLKTSCRSQK